MKARQTTRWLGAVMALCVLGGCGGSAVHRELRAPRVSPVGAPYSYVLPEGFRLTSASFPGGGARYLSVVVPKSIAHAGMLSAFQWPLDDLRKRYPTNQLINWIDHQTLQFYRGAHATLRPGTRTLIGGRPAICWQIEGFSNPSDGLVDVDGCAIVAGHHVVQQACTWKPQTRALISLGCRQLRSTLRVF